MVVPPPLAFNPILEVFLVSRAKQISRKILIYAGGLKKHHIGSWCPGGHSIWPLLFLQSVSRGSHTRLRIWDEQGCLIQITFCIWVYLKPFIVLSSYSVVFCWQLVFQSRWPVHCLGRCLQIKLKIGRLIDNVRIILPIKQKVTKLKILLEATSGREDVVAIRPLYIMH